MTAESKADQLLLAQLADKQRQCERRQLPVWSDFLDERQQALAAGQPVANSCFWGGYAGAERRLLIFLPDYLTAAALTEPQAMAELWQGEDCPLLVLRAVPTAKNSGLTHRDYLGALLALGIERGKIGDLLVGEAGADIVIMRELADYLLLNYERAGRCTLQTQLLPTSVLQQYQAKVQEQRVNVSSLRLDTVAAAAFGVARGKAAAAINARLLAVNGQTAIKPDQLLEQGVKLVWQGRGKVRLAEVGGKTRKDRIWLVIEKYI